MHPREPDRFGLIALFALTLSACGQSSSTPNAAESDWRASMNQVRMAVRGAEDDPAMARRWTAYKAHLEAATGLPVKLYESADYNGTIQALSSGQVDLATLGGASYANVDAQIGPLIQPILAPRQAEGAMGYYSALMVKADSPYRTLADLKGKTFGFIDYNSTSGYIYPRWKMRQEGLEPETFFGRIGMAGGHTQAVMALENGQFDAIVVNVSGGTPETGFTTGAHFTMARRGLVDLDDFRIIWTAGPIPNSPMVVRSDRPQAFVDVVRGAMAALPYDEPEIWRDTGQADGSAFAPVDRGHYEDVIALRNQDIAERRSGARRPGRPG